VPAPSRSSPARSTCSPRVPRPACRLPPRGRGRRPGRAPWRRRPRPPRRARAARAAHAVDAARGPEALTTDAHASGGQGRGGCPHPRSALPRARRHRARGARIPPGARARPRQHRGPAGHGGRPGRGERPAMRGLARLAPVLALVAAGCAPAPPVPPAAAPAPPAPRPAVVAPPAAPDLERWTGLVVDPVTEALAASANLGRVEGLYVRHVEPGSPGARAGIRPGDVVLLVGRAYVATPDALAGAVAGFPLGSTVDVAVRRGGELLALKLPVEASPGGRLMVVIRP